LITDIGESFIFSFLLFAIFYFTKRQSYEMKL